ncbi:MAG: hypothetical protein PHV71_01855 [Eubacteriales bacterium]|nr:hypothetical protein [Eubacteriales bacterium]MDD4629331.1 hypothetical protein [Eubacteriales bacterium]
MNSRETIALVSTLSIIISEQIPNNEELGLLSAALTQLGDTLSTIAAQRTLQERKNSSPENSIVHG